MSCWRPLWAGRFRRPRRRQAQRGPDARHLPGPVIEHHGDVIVRLQYEGTYDKTNLPDPLILTSYFSLRDGKIATLVVISARPLEA